MNPENARYWQARRDAKARRDQFAMAALTGLLANREWTYYSDAAEGAVRLADETIAALDKETP